MMARALQLARLGQYWASPNPHVGCVLERGGHIIGEGFTQPAGGNHAEIEALLSAGDARNATAYVTLEPCSHQGRTGPCARALVEAGVSAVVIAMQDPNPQVAGGGIALLREAGIAVSCGLMESQAQAIIPGFIARMTRGRPRVRVKMAMSLDGRTAMASGESQWITGAAARADVQRLRARSCAIVTGVATVLADDCSLTVRPEELGLVSQQLQRATVRAPARVVLDSQLRTPTDARVLSGVAPTVLMHSCENEASFAGAAAHVQLRQVAAATVGLDLHRVMSELSALHYNEILVESGPRLAGALLQAQLVDELIVYMAPILMGDEARPLLHLPLQSMASKVPLKMLELRQVGEDVRMTLVPQYASIPAP